MAKTIADLTEADIGSTYYAFFPPDEAIYRLQFVRLDGAVRRFTYRNKYPNFPWSIEAVDAWGCPNCGPWSDLELHPNIWMARGAWLRYKHAARLATG